MNEIVRRALNFISTNNSPGQAAMLQEAARMSPKADESAPEGTDLPYIEGKTPRLVIFCGLPSLKWLSNYCNTRYVKENIRGIIIVEANKQRVCNMLNEPQFIKFLASPMMRFILCPKIENIKSLLFNVLKEPEFSRIVKLAMIFPYDQVTEEEKAIYDYVGDNYEETMFHVFHNYGRIDDSIEGLKASLLNRNTLTTYPGIAELKDKALGKVIIIVGAGPSLDHDIDQLAKNKDKFVIIAVDAAVKPLLKAGIEPDFTTSIERGNIYQKPFWEGLPAINTQLVHFPVVHPEVLALYPGPLRPVYRNYTYFAYFEYSWPKGIMHSGGSTSHLANRLAVHLGAKEIVYVALDNCYEKHATENSYRSHCHGLGYEEWAGYHPIEYFSKEKNHAPAYKVIAFDGSDAVTNVTYHQWAKEFEEEVLVLGLEGRVYHTNPKAVAIAGVKYSPLETICNSIEDTVDRSVFTGKAAIQSYREWDNKYIIKCFKGWHNLAQFAINELDKLTPETASVQKIATIYDFLDQKFTKDNMFIAFVIQNCASEYYDSTNAWHSLPNDLTLKISERLQVLKNRANLYEEVLGKLIKTFEETV